MPTITRLKDLNKNKPKSFNQSAKYYNSKQWYSLRNNYFRLHPLCEKCLSSDIVKAAEEIHHKIPFLTGLTEEQRWNLLLDKNNLIALCKECHIEAHKTMKSAK